MKGNTQAWSLSLQVMCQEWDKLPGTQAAGTQGLHHIPCCCLPSCDGNQAERPPWDELGMEKLLTPPPGYSASIAHIALGGSMNRVKAAVAGQETDEEGFCILLFSFSLWPLLDLTDQNHDRLHQCLAGHSIYIVLWFWTTHLYSWYRDAPV